VDLGLFDSLAARFVPVFAVVALLVWWRWPLRLPRKAWPRIAAMSLIGVPGYHLFFLHGLKTVPTGTAALIVALNPVFTAVLARLFLGEAFDARKVIGLVLSLAGVFVVIRYGTDKPVDWPYLSSALLLALSPLCWAIYTVIGRSVPAGADPFDTTWAVLLLGSLPALVLARPSTVRTLAHSPGALGAALYLAVPCTILAYAGWIWALKRVPAGQAAAFVFLNPPLANLWAWLVGETTLRPAFLAGAAILLAGVAAIVLPSARTRIGLAAASVASGRTEAAR